MVSVGSKCYHEFRINFRTNLLCWDLISNHHWDVRLVIPYVSTSLQLFTSYPKTTFNSVVWRDCFLFWDAFWHGATRCQPIQKWDPDIKMIRERTPEKEIGNLLHRFCWSFLYLSRVNIIVQGSQFGRVPAKQGLVAVSRCESSATWLKSFGVVHSSLIK